MNKKVVAIIVVVLAVVAIWYGYNQMKPYLTSPPADAPDTQPELVDPEVSI